MSCIQAQIFCLINYLHNQTFQTAKSNKKNMPTLQQKVFIPSLINVDFLKLWVKIEAEIEDIKSSNLDNDEKFKQLNETDIYCIENFL